MQVKLDLTSTGRVDIIDMKGSTPTIKLLGGADPLALSATIGADRALEYPEATVQLAKAKREQSVGCWRTSNALSVTWGASVPGFLGRLGLLSDLDRLAVVLSRLHNPEDKTRTFVWGGPNSNLLSTDIVDGSMTRYTPTEAPISHEAAAYMIADGWLTTLRSLMPGVDFKMLSRPSTFNNPGGGPHPGALMEALRSRVVTPGHTPIRLYLVRVLSGAISLNTVAVAIYGEFKSELAPWITGIDNTFAGPTTGDWGDYALYAPETFEGAQVTGMATPDFFGQDARRKGVRVGLHPDLLPLLEAGLMGTSSVLASVSRPAVLTAEGSHITWKQASTYNHMVDYTTDVTDVTFPAVQRFRPLHAMEFPFGDVLANQVSKVEIGIAPVAPQFLDEIVLVGPWTEKVLAPGHVELRVDTARRDHIFKGEVAVAMADALDPLEVAQLKSSSILVQTWTSNQISSANPIADTAVYAQAASAGEEGVSSLMDQVLIPANGGEPAVTVKVANDRAKGKSFTWRAYMAAVPGTGTEAYRVTGTPTARVFEARLITGGPWYGVEDVDVLSGYLTDAAVSVASTAIAGASDPPTQSQLDQLFSEIAGSPIEKGSLSTAPQTEFSEVPVVAGAYDRATWTPGRKGALDVTHAAVNRRGMLDVLLASYSFGKHAASRFNVLSPNPGA